MRMLQMSTASTATDTATLHTTAPAATTAAAPAATGFCRRDIDIDSAETETGADAETETETETETEPGTETEPASSSTSSFSAISAADTTATTTTTTTTTSDTDSTATEIALARSVATKTNPTAALSDSDLWLMMSPGSTAATRRNYKTNSTADLELKVDGIFSPIVSDHQSHYQQPQRERETFGNKQQGLGQGQGREQTPHGLAQRQGQGQGYEHGHGHGLRDSRDGDDDDPSQQWQCDGSHPSLSTNASSATARPQPYSRSQLPPRLQQKNSALSLDTDWVNAEDERRNLHSRGSASQQQQQQQHQQLQEQDKTDPSPRPFWYSPATATTPTAPKTMHESFDFENTHLPEEDEQHQHQQLQNEDNHQIDSPQPQGEDDGQDGVVPRTGPRRRNPNREVSFAPGMFHSIMSSASLDDQRTIHLPPMGDSEPGDGDEGGEGGENSHNNDSAYYLPLPRSLADQTSGRSDSYHSAAGTATSGYLSVNGFLDEYTPSSLTGSCTELGLNSNQSSENDRRHMHQQRDSHHNINGYDEYDTPRSSPSSPSSLQQRQRDGEKHGASAADFHNDDNGDSDATPTYLPFHYPQSDTQVNAQAHSHSRTRSSQSHIPPQLHHHYLSQQQSKPSRTNTENTETSASPFYTPLETPEHHLDLEHSSFFPSFQQGHRQHQSIPSAYSTPTTPTATHTTAAYMSQPPYPPALHVNSPQLPPLEAPKPERLHARPQFSLSTPTSPVKTSFLKDGLPDGTNSPTPGHLQPTTSQPSSMGLNAGNGLLPESLKIPSATSSSSGYRPSSQHDAANSFENNNINRTSTNGSGSLTSQQQTTPHPQSPPPPPPPASSYGLPRRSTTSDTSAPRRASVSLASRRNSRSQQQNDSNNNPSSPTAAAAAAAAADTSGYEDKDVNGHRLSHSQSQPKLRPLTRVETFRTQQRRLSRSRRRRREEEDDDKVMVGTKVDQNHQNFVTAYNMLTGIRFTVSRTNAKIDRPLKDEDFDACFKFSFDVSGRELTPSAKYDFKFKDYAPWVFRHLRARFKLDPADYLMSLTSKYILSELGSPGKSGSFFYFSRDYKYIIKTIHHSEHKLLRRILRDYYEHVDKNPNTLISQFYGLHRVKMAYGRKIHFVVMNNLFPPHRDIHQMFDLKGSTVGRDYREEDLARNPRATMKDLNWLRREKRLHCGPLRKEVFLAQVKRDVALLQRCNIMDYSLLVGMHDTRKGNDEQLRDRALQVYQPGNKGGQLKGLGSGAEEQARQSADSSGPAQDGSVLAQAQGPRIPNLEHTSSQKYSRPSRQSFREMSIPLERMKDKSVEEILDQTKQLVFYSEEGGFRATNQAGDAIGEIYYLGIIDCLTTYGVVKKAENFWKGLSHNRNEISPIPPVSYANRFIEFIEHITKSPEQHAQEREEREREKERQRALGLRPSISSDGPSDSTPNFFHSPNGKGKGSADGTGNGPHHQHIFTSMNDPSGSSAAVLPVVEEVPGESNASIRSQHASSMQIYENLMKGTSSRYEVRLSAGPGLPGSHSPSNVRRPTFTLPESLNMNMEGNPYGYPPDSAGTEGTGDEGRAGSAGSAGSDSSYGGGGPGGPGLGHGHECDSAGPGSGAGHAAGTGAGGPFAAYDEHHTNVGGQQQRLPPVLPNFMRSGQHGGADDYANAHSSQSQSQQQQQQQQQQSQQRSAQHAQPYRPYLYEDNYAYDTDATPPSSSTMHVPHMPPPPDSLPPPPPPEHAPPHPPSPPPSWEREGEQRAHQRSMSGGTSSDDGTHEDAPTRSSLVAKNEMFLDSFPNPPLSPTMSRS